jgi:hypothetical protein
MSGDADAAVPSGASSFRFDVTPYESDGGYSLPALLVCFALVFAFAIGLGYLAHFPDNWLPGIEWVVALGLGFILAGLGCLAVGSTRVRSAGTAGLAGLLGGVLALGAMHYWNYQDYLGTLDGEVKKYVAGQVAFEAVAQVGPKGMPIRVNPVLVDPRRTRSVIPDRIAAEVKPVIRKQVEAGQLALPALQQALGLRKEDPPPNLGPEVNAAVAAAIRDFGYWEYLDWRATQGADLALPKVRKNINLGYTGSYILWAVEALIVGAIAAGFMALRSQKPFCTACNLWKEERSLGRLDLDAARAQEIFSSGALAELAGEDLARKDGSLGVTIRVCGRCLEECPVDVRLTQFTKKKDKEESSELAHLTYPGPALRVLEALLAPLEAPAEGEAGFPPADHPHD